MEWIILFWLLVAVYWWLTNLPWATKNQIKLNFMAILVLAAIAGLVYDFIQYGRLNL